MEKRRKWFKYSVFAVALLAFSLSTCGNYDVKPGSYVRPDKTSKVNLGKLERSTLGENPMKPSLVSPDGTTYAFNKYFPKK